MEEQDIKPSRSYYALGAVILVGGAVLFGMILWKGLKRATANLQRVVAPGETEITLAQPGDYTIFYEYESVVGDRIYSTGEGLEGLQCGLVSKDTGSSVHLFPTQFSTSYSFGGRAGKSVMSFHIDRPGNYQIQTRYAEGQSGSQVVLAVGHDVGRGITMTVLSGLGVLFGSFALGLVILAVTFYKRYTARKRRATAGGPPPPIE